MVKHGKRYKKAVEGLGRPEVLPAEVALKRVKELAFARFDESVDANINLGIDPTKGDQVVRGSVVLPHSRGKLARVVVFAKGDYADVARRAGADYVGADDLVEKIGAGWMDFEYVVATPDMMGIVGKLARILGPKGLLPNKKLGTVTFDIDAVVADLKRGRIFFKNDKSGIVHFSFGKISLEAAQLLENWSAFVKALMAAKPASSKGKYLKKVTFSSTMGVGIHVNADEMVRI